MKETETLHRFELDRKANHQKDAGVPRRRRRCLRTSAIVCVVLILILIVLAVILYFTVFKPKDPETTLVSASVAGVAPRISIPAIRFELNITIDLEISVHNPNHASFKHGQGKSLVFYKENQVGEVDVSPGKIPATGSETVKCRLILEVEKFASEMTSLISDVLAGEIEVDVQTRIPGRVNFLGIFRRHAVATSRCRIAFGLPDLKIRRQECRNKTKL